jgi:hypothetical protein
MTRTRSRVIGGVIVFIGLPVIAVLLFGTDLSAEHMEPKCRDEAKSRVLSRMAESTIAPWTPACWLYLSVLRP